MTVKGDTNRKWTSSDSFRANYDRIFGDKSDADVCPCDHCEVDPWMQRIGCVCDDKLDWNLRQMNKNWEQMGEDNGK